MSDQVNGLFEAVGSLFIVSSIFRIYKEKEVRGITWQHVAFFMSWGYWNVYYYPSIGQWWSFLGGLLVCLVNTIWFCMMLYYLRKQNAHTTTKLVPVEDVDSYFCHDVDPPAIQPQGGERDHSV